MAKKNKDEKQTVSNIQSAKVPDIEVLAVEQTVVSSSTADTIDFDIQIGEVTEEEIAFNNTVVEKVKNLKESDIVNELVEKIKLLEEKLSKFEGDNFVIMGGKRYEIKDGPIRADVVLEHVKKGYIHEDRSTITIDRYE